MFTNLTKTCLLIMGLGGVKMVLLLRPNKSQMAKLEHSTSHKNSLILYFPIFLELQQLSM